MNKKIKQKEINFKEIIKLFFELGQLRRVHHSGFKLTGIENPDSVAEHTLRVAQIGYVLAKMENADENKVTKICLFHELGETRVGDANRVELRYRSYFYLKKSELEAYKDQVKILPEKIKKDLTFLMEEFDERKTLEARCAKDADYLEQALTAKEYIDIGYKGCKDWIKNVKKALKTGTAKKFLKVIEKTDRNEWWGKLKELKEVLAK